MQEPVDRLRPDLGREARELAVELRNMVSLLEETIRSKRSAEDKRESQIMASQFFRDRFGSTVASIQSELVAAGYSAERVKDFGVPYSPASAFVLALRLESLAVAIWDANPTKGQ